ncbi:MAG: TraR/DksA C4-type zinc finger protein [Calditrichaceae bacterium]|jgi:DnaK suppressor protein
MTEEKLNHYRDLLLRMRQDTQAKEEHYRNRLEENPADYESGNKFAFHIADEGTEGMEREKESMMYAREERTLREIDAALDRVEKGDYGKCENCGKQISDERLESVPVTTLCAECINKINPPQV